MSGDPKRPYDALRRVIGPVAAPVYGAVVSWRNRRFDRGIGVRRVPVPVVSVGNLTVGGTGKTPFVMWLCRGMEERGIVPAVAMRGYKSQQNEGRSDEAEEYKRALPSMAVIVNPDRYAGIARWLGRQREGVVVLDDGFQHRQLHRDLDIVLIDAQAGTFDDRLLPAGDLREPVSALGRADVVVLTHADGASDLTVQKERAARVARSGALIVKANYAWAAVKVREGDIDHEHPLGWLSGRRVVTVCGIGRPERFLRGVVASGCDLVESFVLPDHGVFTPAVIERVRNAIKATGANAVLMTEKDYARLGLAPWDNCAVARPRVELSVERGDEIVDRVMRHIPAEWLW